MNLNALIEKLNIYGINRHEAGKTSLKSYTEINPSNLASQANRLNSGWLRSQYIIVREARTEQERDIDVNNWRNLSTREDQYLLINVSKGRDYQWEWYDKRGVLIGSHEALLGQLDEFHGDMIEQETPPSNASFFSYQAVMRTKPFLLLAGISGTGKSRIVKEMAFASCPPSLRDASAITPGNYCMIEVKPNWHDSTELLGYYSAISEKYMVTLFINFLIKAWLNPQAPFFVCLDEMNLAPVEQYLAEFLSVLESRKLIEGIIVSEALIKSDVIRNHIDDFKFSYYGVDDENHIPNQFRSILNHHDEIWSSFVNNGISLPPNLIVIGTVNMDETTYQFSRKVIDRAMTIEMNEVNFASIFDEEKSDTLKYCSNYMRSKSFLPKYASARDAYESLVSADDQKLLKEDAVEKLKGLDKSLKDTPFRIAYRVQNELVIYFVALREEQKDVDGTALLNSAFDDILMMKVLPRIQGGDELKGTLMDLFEFTASDYPKANAKVKVMLDSLKEKHFTSFWP